MKRRTFFQKTISLTGINTRYGYELSLNMKAENVDEILVTTREEAAECTAYLEELFRAPGVERTMIRIVRAIQQPLECLLLACGTVVSPGEWDKDELEAGELMRGMVKYCYDATAVLCPVLEHLADLFFTFIDQDRSMPDIYYFKRAQSFEQMWQTLLADKDYSEAVMDEMNWLRMPFGFDDAGVPRSPMTYREIDDLEETMLKTLDIAYAGLPDEKVLLKLRAHLWNSNFNMAGYAKAVFRREISGLHSLSLPDQLTSIVQIINRIRKRKRVTQMGLSDNPPLKDAVIALLMAHLDGLKLAFSTTRFLTTPESVSPPLFTVGLGTEKLGYLLRYLQEHNILTGTDPSLLLQFVSIFFQPAGGGTYEPDELAAAYHATPVISGYNVKRILDPHQ